MLKEQIAAEARLEIWARATIDIEKNDLTQGHDGRSRMSQGDATRAAEDALRVLSAIARLREERGNDD